MALDRFIYECKRTPKRKEMRLILEDFFGEGATEIKWSIDRFFITLVGQDTCPFLRTDPDSIIVKAHVAERESDPEGRYVERGRHMEVWVKGKTVDVMTRRADEFTNSVAAGLARLIARYWRGRLEEG